MSEHGLVHLSGTQYWTVGRDKRQNTPNRRKSGKEKACYRQRFGGVCGRDTLSGRRDTPKTLTKRIRVGRRHVPAGGCGRGG